MSSRVTDCRLGRCLAAVLVLLAGLPGAARAQSTDGPEVLHLRSGRQLTGQSLSVEDDHLRWRLAPDEEMLIPLSWIERLEVLPATPPDGVPPSPSPASPPPTTPDQPAAAERPWLESVPLYSTVRDWYSGFQDAATTWTRRIQVGGNFVDGNTQTDLVDVMTDFERGTPTQMRQFDFGGQWGRNNSRQTANRWFANSNFDWPLDEGNPWIMFVTSKNEYNALQNLDYRGTLSTGMGYRFVFEPKRRLIARFGPAYTVEVFHDPAQHRETPDIFAELEARWPLFKRTTFEQKMRVQPSVLDFELVRVFSTSGLMVDLDEKDRWKLRLGFQYTYNSQPNPGRVPSDYITTLSLVYVRK